MKKTFAVTRLSYIDEVESISDLVLYDGSIRGCILFILSSMLSECEELTWEVFDSKIKKYQIYCGLHPSPRYNDIRFIRQYISDNNLITK